MTGPKDVTSKLTRIAAIAAAAALAVTMAACSSPSTGGGESGGETISIDVGADKPITWTLGQDLKIAFFAYGNVNGWQAAQIEYAKKAADDAGAELQVFDAKGDPQTQFAQMQTALTTGSFNAWMVMPTDGVLLCDMVTKQAPAANILVVTEQAPVCGNDGVSGDAARVPGTFGFVGGTGSSAMWESIAEFVAADNPGDTQAIVLSGPASVGSVKESTAAWDKMVKDNPNIQIVATLPTDFSTAQGFSATQTALAQHPEADIILSVYAGVTQGAVKAIEAAGLAGKVKLYDQGGDAASVQAIKDGIQTMTAPDFPGTKTRTMVELIVKVNNGEISTPQSIMNDGSTWGQDGGQFFVTKDNVDDYTAEYE